MSAHSWHERRRTYTGISDALIEVLLDLEPTRDESADVYPTMAQHAKDVYAGGPPYLGPYGLVKP